MMDGTNRRAFKGPPPDSMERHPGCTMIMRITLLLISASFLSCSPAGVPEVPLWESQAEHPYVPPTDPQVAEKLDQWQDRKFGLPLHVRVAIIATRSSPKAIVCLGSK